MAAQPDPDRKAAEWCIPAVGHHVAGVRRAVAEYVGRVQDLEDRVYDVALAVSEAVSNAVTHAYRDGSDGSVNVTVRETAAGVEVVVEDVGVGLRPRPDSPGLGLGLPLIAQLADDFTVSPGPDGRGVAVAMTFKR
jgi:anti-sigma regulatory factor (Ser/Thr protein kinase)